MVSAFHLLVSAGLAFQNPQAVQTSNSAGTSAPAQISPPQTPAPNLSPEMRGDIMMARKMYREALDLYKPGANTSAVLANKTGIAYHQMLDLDDARKYYERAIKLNRQYAEA